MDYAHILVHVPNGEHRSTIIATALGLSRRFDAALTALHVDVPDPHDYVTYGEYPIWASPQTLRRREQAAQAHDATLQAEFRQQARCAGVTRTQWCYHQSELAPAHHWAETIANYAGRADIIVMGQHDPAYADGARSHDTPALVAKRSTRPTLVVPYASGVTNPGRHIVLAWDASPTAHRAVAAALPLLARADTVDVIMVDDRTIRANSRARDPGAEIVRYLAHHAIAARVAHRPYAGRPVSDILLTAVADQGADLVCMGAYGHARLREYIFGGVTRDMLRQMTVPTVLAH